MNLPCISVIVATYRRLESLKRALDSLAVQTYENLEIILVDDNADASWNNKVSEIVDELRTKGNNIDISLITNYSNKGSAESRNIGIRVAKGEYITFLDDDDVYLPEKIEKQYISMKNADADYGITDLFLYNEDDVLVDKRRRNYISDFSQQSLFEYHLKYHMTGTDTFMFRKEYLINIGCFDSIDVGDEFYLMIKAIKGDGKFSYLSECYVKAYVHTGDDGLSSGKSKIDGENQLFEYKKKYFSDIDYKRQRYIKMRHYAVLAFAGIRMKNVLYALKNGVISFCSSPIECIRLCLERKL